MPDSSALNQPERGDDRSARVEELLVSGLDYYFAGQHERAISVWTRVLFLDRNHARARAYIERARSALAERQRESEELIQQGIAAFDEGEAAKARRLLSSAVARGGPHDVAIALLDRLNRLDPASAAAAAVRTDGPPVAPGTVVQPGHPRSRAWLAALILPLLAIAGALAYITWSLPDSVRTPRAAASAASAARPARDSLPLPRSADLALGRARNLVAQGHLKEALSELETINPGDPAHPDAERLRADIQQSLLAGLPPLGGDR